MIRIINIILTLLILLSSHLFADQLTEIKADKIIILKNNNLINFKKNVSIINQDYEIFADYMDVYLYNKEEYQAIKEKKTSGKNGRIKRIYMTNNIKIFNDNQIINAENGIYYPEKSEIILENNVIVNEGTSVAKGDKFIYNLDSGNGDFTNKNDNKDNKILLIINEDLDDRNNK